MADLKNQIHFPHQDKSLVQLSPANSFNNQSRIPSMGLKLDEIECSSSQQLQANPTRFSNSQPQLSANNSSTISYSTAKTTGSLTQMTLSLQPSQWIPTFPFSSSMSLPQRSRFANECTFMNVKTQKKLIGLPSHIQPQNVPHDLTNSIIKTTTGNNFPLENGITNKESMLSTPENIISLITNPTTSLKDKNPITYSLKQFLIDSQENQKRNISSIPNEILNLPYFDIKSKKTNRKWESLYEEVKHSKEIFDRSEWAQKCQDALLINVPMFEGEDLRVIALAALTMGNCSFASCTKVERLSFNDPETERQRNMNPLRSPPILIKFDSPANRCRFIKEFNQHRFTVADFKNMLKNPGAQDDRIYAEENLTAKNKEILQKVVNLKRLNTIQDFKIIDGRIAIYMNEGDQGTLIFDIDDLYDALEKRVNSLQQLRILYKQQINALTDQSFNEYFEKWFKIKNDLIDEILEN